MAGGLFHGQVYVWQTDGQRQSVLEAHREEACLEGEAQAEISALTLSTDGRTLALETRAGQAGVMKRPG